MCECIFGGCARIADVGIRASRSSGPKKQRSLTRVLDAFNSCDAGKKKTQQNLKHLKIFSVPKKNTQWANERCSAGFVFFGSFLADDAHIRKTQRERTNRQTVTVDVGVNDLSSA